MSNFGWGRAGVQYLILAVVVSSRSMEPTSLPPTVTSVQLGRPWALALASFLQAQKNALQLCDHTHHIIQGVPEGKQKLRIRSHIHMHIHFQINIHIHIHIHIHPGSPLRHPSNPHQLPSTLDAPRPIQYTHGGPGRTLFVTLRLAQGYALVVIASDAGRDRLCRSFNSIICVRLWMWKQ